MNPPMILPRPFLWSHRRCFGHEDDVVARQAAFLGEIHEIRPIETRDSALARKPDGPIRSDMGTKDAGQPKSTTPIVRDDIRSVIACGPIAKTKPNLAMTLDARRVGAT